MLKYEPRQGFKRTLEALAWINSKQGLMMKRLNDSTKSTSETKEARAREKLEVVFKREQRSKPDRAHRKRGNSIWTGSKRGKCQKQALINYLKERNGASRLEIIRETKIASPTALISILRRKEGIEILHDRGLYYLPEFPPSEERILESLAYRKSDQEALKNKRRRSEHAKLSTQVSKACRKVISDTGLDNVVISVTIIYPSTD